MALTVAGSVGLVVGVLAGAQRSETAFDRLRAQTHAGDLAVGREGRDMDGLVEDVAAIKGVTAVAAIRELFVRPVGSDLFPDFNLLSIAPWPTRSGEIVDVPLITSGRAPDPHAVDEVAFSERLASKLHVHVGDRIALESMTDAWVDVAYNGGDPGPPDGPQVEVEVVGIARSPVDFGRWAGLIHLTPAFAQRYDRAIRSYAFAEARLTGPLAADVLAGRQPDLAGLKSDELQPAFFSGSTATEDGLRTIATALRLIAATTAVAALTAVGLIVLRLARTMLADRTTLTAIGLTRTEMTRAAMLVHGPWALIGAALGVGLGVVGSPLASVGLARAVDPAERDIVVRVGWVALVAVVVMLAVILLVLLCASRASGEAGGPATTERPRPALRQPLSVSLGLRRAIFGAPDRGGRASRAAIGAATAGVAVAVAALLVGASIERLESDPSLSGQGGPSQRVIDAGEDPDVFTKALAALEADARVADLIGFHVAFGIRAPRAGELTVLVYDVRRGRVDAAILEGRLPVQPDEIAVGPATLSRMRLRVGDSVRLTADAAMAQFRIVGVTLFPEGDFAHDSGIAITLGGMAFAGGIDATVIHQVAFAWAPGIGVAAADRSLERQGYKPFSTFEGLMPADVTNLGQVRTLPRVLAVVIMLLALVTIAHAVAQTTRSRRREAGTLAALGVTPRVIALSVEAQAASVALIAAIVGLPIGLALGRSVWTQIAERASVVNHPVPAWAGTGWLVVAAVVGTMVLAVVPVTRSLRQDPAEALHSE